MSLEEGSEFSPGVGLAAGEQLSESVQQGHTDGPQQGLEAGLHQLAQTLHQTALTAIHLILRRHHVWNERVISGTCLEKE